MSSSNLLFKALSIENNSVLQKFCHSTGVSAGSLKHYNKTNSLPSGHDLKQICDAANISQTKLMIKMGILDRRLISAIQKHADGIYDLIKDEITTEADTEPAPQLVYETKRGKLYEGDCLHLMRSMKSDSIDLIFADPPFNLKKLYPSKIDDNLKAAQYLRWCEEWIDECIRILRPGGNFFLWNLPKWNTSLSHFLNERLTFRHWISVDIKYSLPIPGRLYPSHYSLLYYCKGEKPAKFHSDRFPMPVCPYCAEDLKDYGGYKDKMNPKGVNMTDIWLDIAPVRHVKYKRRNGANELSIKLLDRIIELASDKEDVVFDPFGGSGTTYAVAEIKKRKWIGIELGPVDDIIRRFEKISEEAEHLSNIRKNYNCLFTKEALIKRAKRNLWTPETVRKRKDRQEKLDLKIA